MCWFHSIGIFNANAIACVFVYDASPKSATSYLECTRAHTSNPLKRNWRIGSHTLIDTRWLNHPANTTDDDSLKIFLFFLHTSLYHLFDFTRAKVALLLLFSGSLFVDVVMEFNDQEYKYETQHMHWPFLFFLLYIYIYIFLLCDVFKRVWVVSVPRKLPTNVCVYVVFTLPNRQLVRTPFGTDLYLVVFFSFNSTQVASVNYVYTICTIRYSLFIIHWHYDSNDVYVFIVC